TIYTARQLTLSPYTALFRSERELRADQKEQQELQREELFTWGEAALSLLNGRTAYTLSRVSRARRYKGQAQEGVRESHEVMGDIDRKSTRLNSSHVKISYAV